MRARDLAQEFPFTTLETTAYDAARMMADAGRPGLIVCDGRGVPLTVLPGSQVLRFAIPTYVQEDPHLARVYGEKASDELFSTLAARTVHDMVPGHSDRDDLPIVDPDATSLEVAAVMARMRSPLAVVMDGDEVIGVITVSRLLAAMLHQGPSAPEAAAAP